MSDLERLAADVQAATIGGHLLAEYLKHRDQGHSHGAACKALSRRFALSMATVGRVIDHAQRAETQGGPSKSSSDTARTPRSPAFRPRRSEGLGD